MVQMALRVKLDQARSYLRALLAAEGGLWTAAGVLLAFLACFHLDRLLVLSVEQRIGVWAALGILLSAGVIFLVVRPLLQPVSEEHLAVTVERKYPHLRERLLSAVEFANEPDERLRGVSSVLVEDLQNEAEREASGLDFRAAFRMEGVKRAGTVTAAVTGLLGVHLLLAGPAFGAFLSRMALNNTPVWRDTRVQVDPLRTKILKGADFKVNVEQEGVRVDRARLLFRLGEGRENRVELKADRNGDFSHRFASLTESLTYQARAGDGVSDRGVVEVVDPASIVGAKLKLIYPPYMDRAPLNMEAEAGGIAAPVGTRVEIELKANKPLESAEATLPKSAPEPWPVEGETIRGSLQVRTNSQYSLKLKDTDGFLAPEPQVFPIKAIPDETPEVQLFDPSADLDVVPNARIRLAILAKDDHGIDQVRVPYTVDTRKPASLPAGKGGKRTKVVELDNTWSLAPLNLKPGDTIRYRIEATDFDNVSGPHVGKTAELQIRIIDQSEAERRYQEQRSELLAQLGELIKEQKGARSEVEAQRSAAKPNAERIGAAEERQRGAAVTAADLSRRIQDLSRNAETNNLANRNELESQRQAQQNLSRLAQQAMPQAANRIGSAQAQAQSSPETAKPELGQASQQQQQILEELNRISGQMRPENELQRMAERFERLAREQRNIQAQTDKLLPQTLGKQMSELTPQQRAQLQQLSQQQQSLQRATSQAMQDLEQSARAMKQQGGNQDQAEAAQQTSQQLQQAQVGEQQQQAAQNAQQNSLGQARSQQESAAQELENAAQQLRAAQNPNDPRAMQRQLRQAANQVGRMLQRQQEASQQTRSLMSPEQRKQVAETEKELQRQAQELARRLQRLERRSPSAGQASKAMQQAQQSLGQAGQSVSQSRQQDAQSQQQQAMQAMRQAMQSLQQAMAEAGGEENDPFKEVRQALQKLASQQKALEQGTRSADQKRPEGADNQPGDEELQKLARSQRDLEAATKKLEPELPGDLFRQFSGQARQAMTRAQEALEQGNSRKDPTQDSQQDAQTILEQLAKALDADPKENGDQNQQGQQGGGQQQGQQGGKPDPELLKKIAELRLLRYMQQGIRSDTQTLDDGRREGQELTEAQKQRLQDLAKQQGSAKSMAERLAQGLSRYRSLAGKLSQAGKHMDEAHRGLDRTESGEPVQEEETQAIIRLSEALRQAQQQAQQQSQQRSRQRGQQQSQQPGQQPGQQQDNQQGNQPAMQSRQRAANRQDGALGQFGPDARGFRGLDPRSQDALRQGYKEKIPPEYQELINRYYRALSDRAR